MSILIKNMTMPKRCEECFCYRNNAEYDFAYCNVNSTNILGNGNARLNNCPLVEVPTPHGRLIDADELIKDGWTLQKRTYHTGGFNIAEMPLNNPSVLTIIEAEE